MEKERWNLSYQGKIYPCEITYKRIRHAYFRFDRSGQRFLISCPYRTPAAYLRKNINIFFPKMVGQFDFEPPIKGDQVYLFGVPNEVVGFSTWTEEKQRRFLANTLLTYLKDRVPELEKTMGIEKPYLLRVRKMRSRYGVNNQKSHALTFALLLVHSSREIIDSVIVHELAHATVFNHSAAFYDLVYRYCPSYRLLHAKLRKHQYS